MVQYQPMNQEKIYFELRSYIIALILYSAVWIILLLVLLERFHTVIQPAMINRTFSVYSPYSFLMMPASLIILIVGAIYISKYIAILCYFRKEWKGAGNGNGGPKRPYFTTLFLISLSIFICIILLKIFHINEFMEIATTWSAVYGSVMGTAGFLVLR